MQRHICPSVKLHPKDVSTFNMDKEHSLSIPMVVRLLDIYKDPYLPQEESEEVLGPEVPYIFKRDLLTHVSCKQYKT